MYRVYLEPVAQLLVIAAKIFTCHLTVCVLFSFFLYSFAFFRISPGLEFRNDVTVADKYDVVIQSCFKIFSLC